MPRAHREWSYGQSDLGVPGVSWSRRGGQRGYLPERAGPAGTWRRLRGPAQRRQRRTVLSRARSLGAGAIPAWERREFPGPNGAKDAAIFLNEPDRQGRGEATATLRGDGTAGLLYLSPGSLGFTNTHAWQYGEFVGPKQAVDFLNDPARQGRGEATVTQRKNGTVGLLYLEPGSLGASTAHAWCFKDFSAPYGVRDALAFLNAHPGREREKSADTPAPTGPP